MKCDKKRGELKCQSSSDNTFTATENGKKFDNLHILQRPSEALRQRSNKWNIWRITWIDNEPDVYRSGKEYTYLV